MINKLKQIICALNGHSYVDVKWVEKDKPDVVEHWTVATCRRCGRTKHYIDVIEPKRP